MTATTPDRIYSFSPLVDSNTRLLILGTMPGVVSLENEMYYANQRNHFWDFMYRILKPDLPANHVVGKQYSKDQRYQLLAENGIGLWDVIYSCLRESSNDSKIKDPVYNKLATVTTENIQLVICNGGDALMHMKRSKQMEVSTIPVQMLGSTSTLNPTNTFQLFNQWQQVITSYLAQN